MSLVLDIKKRYSGFMLDMQLEAGEDCRQQRLFFIIDHLDGKTEVKERPCNHPFGVTWSEYCTLMTIDHIFALHFGRQFVDLLNTSDPFVLEVAVPKGQTRGPKLIGLSISELVGAACAEELQERGGVKEVTSAMALLKIK